MDAKKIDEFLISQKNNFPQDKITFIRDKMGQMDDGRYPIIGSIKFKNPKNLTLISIFLGYIGIDRFMMGETGMGILKMLTGGLCRILWIVDIVNISKKAKEYNYNELMKVL